MTNIDAGRLERIRKTRQDAAFGYCRIDCATYAADVRVLLEEVDRLTRLNDTLIELLTRPAPEPQPPSPETKADELPPFGAYAAGKRVEMETP